MSSVLLVALLPSRLPPAYRPNIPLNLPSPWPQPVFRGWPPPLKQQVFVSNARLQNSVYFWSNLPDTPDTTRVIMRKVFSFVRMARRPVGSYDPGRASLVLGWRSGGESRHPPKVRGVGISGGNFLVTRVREVAPTLSDSAVHQALG
jgi:hypothetical protein